MCVCVCVCVYVCVCFLSKYISFLAGAQHFLQYCMCAQRRLKSACTSGADPDGVRGFHFNPF